MASGSFYTDGTVSITNNTAALVGSGTAWLTAGLQEGDKFLKGIGVARILTVVDNTHITLAENWTGGTLAGATYAMEFQPDGARLTAKVQALLTALGSSGNVDAFAALVGAADKLGYFTGSGAMALADFTSTARSLLDDTSVGAMRNTLGVGTGDSPQFAGVNIGNASDTTVTRAAAGELNVEGSRVFQRSNILAAVSQSGGVPTGGIVERGSNANGEYVRFADGTQICWLLLDATAMAMTTAVGSLFRSDPPDTWTYPAAFAANPVFNSLPRRNGTTYVWSVHWQSMSTTSATYFTYASSSVAGGGAKSIGLTAIGRWY